jgi:hypothetical protein
MYICYIDEAGCLGALPDEYSSIQPAIIIVGLIIDSKNIPNITNDFLLLKQNSFPKKFREMLYLDCIKEEIKGSEIRKMIREKGRNKQRFALRFIDKSLQLLEKYKVSICGRIWIKSVGNPFNGKAVYSFSIQNIARGFQHYLSNNNSEGIIIADSRRKSLNSNVSHSIFTQKFKIKGDDYGRIVEMPVYGHSDNHACLQLADFVASALVFPIATSVYCCGYIKNRTHHHPKYLILREQFGERLSKLQYSYPISNRNGKISKGGLVVSDSLGKKKGGDLFKAPRIIPAPVVVSPMIPVKA